MQPTVHISAKMDDLSEISSRTVEKLYASHTLEHLSPILGKDVNVHGYSELCQTLAEFNRVMVMNGEIYISVPDVDMMIREYARLSKTLPRSDKNGLLMQIYGGQTNVHDYHKIGFHFEELEFQLNQFGFCGIQKVDNFGFFKDASTTVNIYPLNNNETVTIPLSINVNGTKCKDIELVREAINGDNNNKNKGKKRRKVVVDKADESLFVCQYP